MSNQDPMQKAVEDIVRIVLTFLKETVVPKHNVSQNTAGMSGVNDLPVILQVKDVCKILGIAKSTGYEIFKQTDFPSLEINGRKLIERDLFFEWVRKQRKS